MRILSLDLRKALYAQESSEVAIHLITITHEDLPDIFRLSTDTTVMLTEDPIMWGTISRGDQYLYVGVELQLPDERDREPPRSRMSMSNIDRSMVPLIRSVHTPPKVKIETVLASAPNRVEISYPEFDLINAEYNAAQISFELSIDVLVLESYPTDSFDPSKFPGLF